MYKFYANPPSEHFGVFLYTAVYSGLYIGPGESLPGLALAIESPRFVDGLGPKLHSCALELLLTARNPGK